MCLQPLFQLDDETTAILIGQTLLQQSMLLSPHQVKESELLLIEGSGLSLAEFRHTTIPTNIFRDIEESHLQSELKRLNPLVIKSSGLSANANLKAFAYVLLQSIYRTEVKQDMVLWLKCWLYSSQVDLTTIQHSPLPQYSNIQMKKLVVEFLYQISYSSSEERVLEKLRKYPVMIEILVVFLRKVLSSLKVSKANNYIFTIPTQQIYPLLTQFFHLQFRNHGPLFLFYHHHLFITYTHSAEVLFGTYRANQSQASPYAPHNFHFHHEDQDDEESQNQELLAHHPDLTLQNRVEPARVTSSLFVDTESATPCFNNDSQELLSFHHYRKPSLRQQLQQNNDSPQRNKDASPLKQIDQMQSQGKGFSQTLIMKRTVLFDELSEDKKVMGLNRVVEESPITIDSALAFSIPEETDFSNILKGNCERREEVSPLKRSKSEIVIKTECQAPLEDGSRSQRVMGQKNSHKKHQLCHCVLTKKKNIKLSSNLYQINLTYVQAVPRSVQISPNQLNSCELSQISTPSHNSRLADKCFQNSYSWLSRKLIAKESIFKKMRPDNNPNNTLYKEQQKGMSKPEDGAMSNQNSSDKNMCSKSAHGSKSITPPQISFSYKNPMKYSATVVQKLGRI